MQERLCAIKLKNLILINFVTVFGMDIFVTVHASMIPILTLLKLFQKSKLLINSWGYKT